MHRSNSVQGIDTEGDAYELHNGHLSVNKIIDLIKHYNPTSMTASFTVYVAHNDKEDIKKQIDTYYKRLQKIENYTRIVFSYPTIKIIKGYEQKGNYHSVGINKKRGE